MVKCLFQLNIHKFKCIARFGLMHIAATNLCVWLRTVVKECTKEISKYRVDRGQGVSEDYMILGKRFSSANVNTVQGPVPNKQFSNPLNFYFKTIEQISMWTRHMASGETREQEKIGTQPLYSIAGNCVKFASRASPTKLFHLCDFCKSSASALLPQ